MKNKKCDISQKTLEIIIKKALKKLYVKERELIYDYKSINLTYSHTSERSIVFRFGVYFNDLCKKHRKLKHFNIDCEYNRDEYACKRIDNYATESIIPDLIVHERRNNNNNLLVIEFKGWWENNKDNLNNDICKIERIKDKYHYKFAATCIFAKESHKDCKLSFY